MTFPIRFECTGCGKCCRFPKDQPHYVFVTQAEAAAIVQATGLSWDAATIRDPKGRLSLRTVPYGDEMACRFLDAEGRCTVYEVRPKQCRTFPFWKGHLVSRTAWEKLGETCEGVGRGPVIELGTLRLRSAGRPPAVQESNPVLAKRPACGS